MEDSRSLAEKVIDGDVDIRNYDINNDFDFDDIEKLLGAGIVSPGELAESLAAYFILSGALTFEDRPFADFSHPRQIFLLEQGAVPTDDLSAATFFELREADGWLELLAENADFDAAAPWEKIRDNASADSWFRFLARRPEHADKADWERISQYGSFDACFDMLAEQPEFYERCHCKDELLDATENQLWVDLITRQPGFADVCGLSRFEESELAEILRLRPKLTRKLDWGDDRPVKLVIRKYAANPKTNDVTARNGAWIAFRLPEILKELKMSPAATDDIAEKTMRRREGNAGIWSSATAGNLATKLNRRFRKEGLPFGVEIKQPQCGKNRGC